MLKDKSKIKVQSNALTDPEYKNIFFLFFFPLFHMILAHKFCLFSPFLKLSLVLFSEVFFYPATGI